MNPADPTPDTIVLVHGFWVTPRSWEHWIERYEGKGLRVIAPAYPGFEVEVEALNADPTPIEQVTVPQIIERLEAIVGELESPPIIIGHSAGGVFTQVPVRALPHPPVRRDLLGQRAREHPPWQDHTWVNYDNDGRAPLLFISGSADHLMPPSIQRSNAKLWNDDVVTEVTEFEGPHLLPASPGCEKVADYALDWALAHAALRSSG
jgi:pimeloyl-ACP methyl ester carboxylesterase